MYDEVAGQSFITFRDSRKGNTEFIGSVQYKDSVQTIAGHTCFMVKRVYENRTDRAYYATDLRIDPEGFRGHEVGDWYRKIKEVNGALSLKTIAEHSTHFEIREVIKIIERPVARSEFDLPAKTIVASHHALDKQVELKSPTRATFTCYNNKVATGVKKLSGQSFTSYIRFIVTEGGAIQNIEPYKEDEHGMFKIASDIIKSCGLEFVPGHIDGKPVSSLVYFPVKFGK